MIKFCIVTLSLFNKLIFFTDPDILPVLHHTGKYLWSYNLRMFRESLMHVLRPVCTVHKCLRDPAILSELF